MKKLVISMLFILTSMAISYSQQERDVVFLNSGSIIKGSILDSTQGIIKIETCCGNIFVIERSEIEKMAKESLPKFKHQIKQKGYMNFISLGILLGARENEKTAPFSLMSEHNFRINKYVAVGGIFGYELLEESVIPLGVNVKGFLPDKAKNIFLGTSGGYSFSLENPNNELYEKTTGGTFFTVEAGAAIPVSENNSIFIAVGYRHNKLNYTRTDWWLGEVERQITYNRISIRFGLTIY